MNIFKKIRLFLNYRKTLINNKNILAEKFNIRIDGAQRMYTVINVPEELVGEAYSLKTSDINRISENFVRKYNEDLSKFLNSNNLTELYKIYEIKKVDKYSYLIVIGFSLLNSAKLYNRLYYIVLPSIFISSLLLFFLV
jgi:hypothetical protein